MTPNWKALEAAIGAKRCAGFMFMGRMNGINLLKHEISRRYLNLADDGRAFEYFKQSRFREIELADALLWVEEPLLSQGESLKTPYRAQRRAQRAETLRSVWIAELTVALIQRI